MANKQYDFLGCLSEQLGVAKGIERNTGLFVTCHCPIKKLASQADAGGWCRWYIPLIDSGTEHPLYQRASLWMIAEKIKQWGQGCTRDRPLAAYFSIGPGNGAGLKEYLHAGDGGGNFSPRRFGKNDVNP